jgi:hypothetical protein
MQLEELVRPSAATPNDTAERREQRVSLIMGLRGHSSALTREKVEEVLDDVEGHEGPATSEVVRP